MILNTNTKNLKVLSHYTTVDRVVDSTILVKYDIEYQHQELKGAITLYYYWHRVVDSTILVKYDIEYQHQELKGAITLYNCWQSHG